MSNGATNPSRPTASTPAPEDQERLAALRHYGILDTPKERDFDDLCHLASVVCKTPFAAISFIDDHRQWYKSEIGFKLRETPLEHSICRHTLEVATSMEIGDLLLDPRFSTQPYCSGPPYLRFYAGAVIRTAQGHALGTVCVLDRKPRRLDRKEMEALETLARQVLSMLERKRSEVRLAEKNRLAELRAALGSVLARDESLDAILKRCTELIATHYHPCLVQIWKVEGESVEVQGAAGRGARKVKLGSASRLPLTESRLGERIASGFPQRLTLKGSESAPELTRLITPLLTRGVLYGGLTLDLHGPIGPNVLHDLDPLAYLVTQGIEHHRAKEILRQREKVASFLAQASAELAEVGDTHSTMQKIANCAVPDFADWCIIYLTTEERMRLEHVAMAHIDPRKIRKGKALIKRYSPRLAAISTAIRTGESERIEAISEEILQRVAVDDEHLRHLRSLGMVSSICVPLRQRGEIYGMITFYTAESQRRFEAYHLTAAEDLARRAEVAIENAQLYQQLQEADRSKDEFLATLAHELRNPLAPLSNAVELLSEATERPQRFEETRAMMARQLRHMVRLIDDLLDISRITHNRLDLRLEEVMFEEVARSALEACGPLLRASAHELSIHLPKEAISLRVDPARLAQVISNLLNNAAKYTPPGGKISLSARRKGKENLIISIKDSGVGIEQEMLPKVFDLFAQVRHSLENSRGGMGIGLTLVRRLVELHGGTVEATSAGLGKGSEFTVTLPVVIDPTPTCAASTSEAKGGTHKLKVLVVDDNRDSATTLAALLRRQGHELHTVFDGAEAVVEAQRLQPDAILLDIGLPTLNGYDAARRILKQAGEHPPRLIAMTGWGQEADLRRAREAGFHHHLLKPLDLDALKGLLTRIANAS